MQRDLLPEWHKDAALRRWRAGLLELIGLSEGEAERRLVLLLQFCREQGCDPHELAEACRAGPERMQRRAHYLAQARASTANLIVQSFLVHNGVNVFGDLVCMPSTPTQLRAEQGAQWVPGPAPTEQTHD